MIFQKLTWKLYLNFVTGGIWDRSGNKGNLKKLNCFTTCVYVVFAV